MQANNDGECRQLEMNGHCVCTVVCCEIRLVVGALSVMDVELAGLAVLNAWSAFVECYLASVVVLFCNKLCTAFITGSYVCAGLHL